MTDTKKLIDWANAWLRIYKNILPKARKKVWIENEIAMLKEIKGIVEKADKCWRCNPPTATDADKYYPEKEQQPQPIVRNRPGEYITRADIEKHGGIDNVPQPEDLVEKMEKLLDKYSTFIPREVQAEIRTLLQSNRVESRQSVITRDELAEAAMRSMTTPPTMNAKTGKEIIDVWAELLKSKGMEVREK